ncbi:MAG: hypothetical protein LUH22_19730 [Bacteroides sp.]|nr:hypothetical protein [Bacteroides sp.]
MPKQKNDFKVYYFTNNTQKEIIVNEPEFYEIIKNLILGIDDCYKLIVTSEKINEMKKKDSGVEIFFSKEMNFPVFGKQTLKFRKLLLPFPKESNNSQANQMVELYTGDKKYVTPVYLNSNGASELQKMIEIVNNKMNE